MSLSLQEIITQALGFLVLLFILRKIFWKPVLTMLDARKTRIEHAFEQIEQSKKEIEGMKTDYHKRLEKIEEEARVKLQAAIDEGRKISREIQEKARENAKDALARSKENLSLEVAKARIELRKEIAELTLLASERLIKEKMTDQKHMEKILGMIEELEAKS